MRTRRRNRLKITGAIPAVLGSGAGRVLAGAGMAALLVGACRGAPHPDQARVAGELVRDRHFRNGCVVFEINPPRVRPDPNDIDNGTAIGGKLTPAWARGMAVWKLAQWYSHYDMTKAVATKLPSGSVQYFDGAKAVVFGLPGGPDADLVLALNGRTEWHDTPPRTVGAWPHLFLSQQINSAPLTEYASVHLHLEYELLYAIAHRGPGWSAQRHTAQCLLYLTIQDRRPAKTGMGDYLWFNVPMYDARYRLPQPFFAKDQGNAHKRGTGKFIYNPGGAAYGEVPAEIGKWVTVDVDLLPWMQKALAMAWREGFLAGSHEISDYRVGSIVLGWEVTGPWNVSMQIRNLALTSEPGPRKE